MNGIRIDHSSIETDFLSHLGLKENNRILFTAPFGAGKSTFLQEVFGKNKDYFTINLFPVNYSVSANEDVFELIKFDLLIELMAKYKKEIELVKEDFSALLLSQMFILKELKLTPIIFAILKNCGKIGKSSVEIIEEVKKHYGDFKVKMTEDESENIFAFLNLIQKQKGTEHEMDSISSLIKNLVNRIKEEKSGALSVLVIDDLDRLDPEHTFRLINIFSAHFDSIDHSNKFGFDKVIFVCDFENIRKIFHHRYGSDVDFEGYSNKFFSMDPYEFDNRQYIKEKITDILKKVKHDRYIKGYLPDFQRFSMIVIAIINSLIQEKQLTLRMLLQASELEMDERSFNNKVVKHLKNTDYPIIIIFYLLKSFCNSFDGLRLKLEFLRNKLSAIDFDPSIIASGKNYSNANKEFISICLPFLLPEDLLYEDIGSEIKSTVLKEFDCKLYYKELFNSNSDTKVFVKATVGDTSDSEEILLNPYQVLLVVFDTCKKLGALKL